MCRAVEDLERTASLLMDREIAPWEVLLVLGHRAALLRQGGADLPVAAPLHIVRAFEGLRDWQPLSSWRERLSQLPADVADSIVTADAEERDRLRRVHVVAAWLLRYAGAPLVESMVQSVQQRAMVEIAS